MMRIRSVLTAALVATSLATAIAIAQSNAVPQTPVQVSNGNSADAQNQSLRDLLDLHSDLYSSDRPADQLSLARILYNASNDPQNSADRLALLSAARDAAALAGDFNTAWKLCDIAVEKANASPSQMHLGLFKAGASSLDHPANRDAYCATLVKAIDQALLVDDFKCAREMIQLGRTAADSSQRWNAALDSRQSRFDAQQQTYTAIRPAIDTLHRLPDDPQSNFTVGQYTCFVKNDWHNGLGMFARSGDANLRQLALLDLGEPADTAQQISIADGWNALADARPELAAGARLRAYDWYVRALPLATLDDQRTATESAITALIPHVSNTRPNAAMWLTIGDALSHRGYWTSRVAGGTNAADAYKENFQDLPGAGAMLLGFHYALARLGDSEVITCYQPIYLTPTGETEGSIYGHAYSSMQTWRAPEGYAVGAVRVRGGATINSITITAMRINNDRLNPDDARSSPRIGGAGGVLEILDGHGTPIIGICGRQRDGFVGLGVVYREPVKDE